MLFDARPHPLREFPGSQLGGVDLLNDQPARILQRRQVEPEPLGALEQQAQFLVENEHRRAFAALDRLDREVQGQQRLAGTRRAEDERARSALDAAAQESIQFRRIAWHRNPAELALMLRRDQSREHGHATCFDGHVVIAAAEALAAILDHPQPTPVGTIIGSQLLEPDDAMRDAVHGLVVRVAGEVIEHHDGRSVPCEIMLQRQHLTSITQ